MRSFYITSILKYKTNSREEGGVFIILRKNGSTEAKQYASAVSEVETVSVPI
jgi:hypothetical protein